MQCFMKVILKKKKLFMQYEKNTDNVLGQKQLMKTCFCGTHSAVAVSYRLLMMSVILYQTC